MTASADSLHLHYKTITMDIKILEIRNDVPTPEEECIKLEIVNTCNLHDYAIVDHTYDADGKISDKHVHYIRLPEIKGDKGGIYQLKPGDQVEMYTGENKPIKKTLEVLDEAKKTYLIRRFLSNGTKIWNKDHDKATVLKVHHEYSVTKK